jgi:serine/threonine-protein kinase RsbT
MKRLVASRNSSVVPPAEEHRVPVATDKDIVEARQLARALAEQIGFSPGDATVVATAVSELARNIVDYAAPGEVLVRPVENGTRRGLVLTARDDGPGIRDLALAMRDGYSTAGRLGMGLPGVRRLMDEFEIVSEPGKGTSVTVKKWLTSSGR